MSLQERVIVTFEAEHLSPKDRVRFFYALKGRGEKAGFVEEVGAEHVGPGVIIISPERREKAETFFQYWKCRVAMKPVRMEDT